MKERGAYYDVLERTSKGKINITEWLIWFLSCFLRALDDSEVTISRVLKIAEFWRQNTRVILNKNQNKVINRLAEAGPGGFTGGLTTRKYASMTKTSRATAYRDIADLVMKGILAQNKAKGRSVSYSLVFPD
jgi:Fic family protein